MLWLFGQIWLWLLIAFALGCGVTWLTMRGERREQASHEQAVATIPSPAVPHYPEPDSVPAPLEAEQTQFIPPTRIHDDDEPYDQEAEGHREGQLTPEPVRPSQVYHPGDPGQGAWNGENRHEPEPVWPSDEDWPPAARASEHRPGHGG